MHEAAEPIPFSSRVAVPGCSGSDDPLTAILRRGAQQLLAQAIDAEVAAWINDHAHLVDEDGCRLVVRNGHLLTRSIVTGMGRVEVTQPRAHDRRRPGEAEKFTSVILPPYRRKTRRIEKLIPWLYLEGVCTGDFSDALQALLGPDCPRPSTAWRKTARSW